MADETVKTPAEGDSAKKYTKLVGNTALLTLSNFSSKLLSVFVKPMLTYVMSSQEVLGVSTLAGNLGNLLFPLVSLGISNGVARFALDKRNDQKAVFTVSFLTILIGYAVMWAAFPVVRLVPKVSDYILLIYVYVLTSCLRSLCLQYITGRQWTKLLAVDGLLCTAATIGYYALFLAVLNMGAEGYLLAIICGDVTSICFQTAVGKLYRYLDFRHANKKLWKEIILFSLPMIPAAISFWIINSSDTFIVALACEGFRGQSGDYWTGMLSAAYTLPAITTTLGTIFYQAWQISAVTEEEGREKFYTSVFRTYSGVLFCCAAGIIMLCRPLMVVFKAGYRSAWFLVPFLTLASICTCFNQFFNGIYVVYKKSMNSFVTMLVGAGVNVVLDIAFCLWFGPLGACVASFLGLGIVTLLRVRDCRRLLNMTVDLRRVLACFAVLVCEALWLILALPFATAGSVLLTAGIILFNWTPIWEMANIILPRFLGKRLGGKIAALLAPPSRRGAKE